MDGKEYPAERLIDTEQGLRSLCAELQAAPWLAVDTEFLRERTYYPQLCLLQIASDEVVACIDPLALGPEGMQPLWALLAEPQRVKVLHAAGQDLEIFAHLTGTVPAPLFDTQVAASVLGLGEQIGYANLVQKRLGVELAKSHSRTDWSRRPLNDAELRYAADDVRYLAKLYPPLLQELHTRERLQWLQGEFVAMAKPERYQVAPENAWKRIKGTHQLRGKGKQVLRHLAQWRETEAQRSDQPRSWIVRDEVLTDIARRAPKDKPALSRIRNLKDATIRRFGDKLLALVAAGVADTSVLDDQQRPVVLADTAQPVVDVLLARARLAALEQEISLGAFTSRKELEKLVAGERDLPLLQGWRLEAGGQALLDVLEGRVSLSVAEAQVQLTTL